MALTQTKIHIYTTIQKYWRIKKLSLKRLCGLQYTCAACACETLSDAEYSLEWIQTRGAEGFIWIRIQEGKNNPQKQNKVNKLNFV